MRKANSDKANAILSNITTMEKTSPCDVVPLYLMLATARGLVPANSNLGDKADFNAIKSFVNTYNQYDYQYSERQFFQRMKVSEDLCKTHEEIQKINYQANDLGEDDKKWTRFIKK